MIYLMMITIFTNIIFLTIFPIIRFESFTFDFNLETGIFGWLTPENFIYSLFVFSFVAGMVTLGLQFLVFQYFTPTVVGTVMLMEPVFS
jgi:hypothetical protein